MHPVTDLGAHLRAHLDGVVAVHSLRHPHLHVVHVVLARIANRCAVTQLLTMDADMQQAVACQDSLGGGASEASAALQHTEHKTVATSQTMQVQMAQQSYAFDEKQVNAAAGFSAKDECHPSAAAATVAATITD